MTSIGALYWRARKQPHAVAFVAGDNAWSYQYLATETERLARALLGRGVRTGDRVALHMANLPELAVAYYARFRIGAIACPLNIRLKTAELHPLLEQLQPVLYLGQAQLYPRIASSQPNILASDALWSVRDTLARPFGPLKTYIKCNQVEPDHSYSAYPGASVRDDRAGLGLRQIHAILGKSQEN